MNEKKYKTIIIVLFIALLIMTGLYFNMRRIAKGYLNNAVASTALFYAIKRKRSKWNGRCRRIMR